MTGYSFCVTEGTDTVRLVLVANGIAPSFEKMTVRVLFAGIDPTVTWYVIGPPWRLGRAIVRTISTFESDDVPPLWTTTRKASALDAVTVFSLVSSSGALLAPCCVVTGSALTETMLT